jgi:hypothetical protein
MSDSSAIAIYLIPGMKADIYVPLNPDHNTAEYPTQLSTFKALGGVKTLQNGFYVANEDVGVIERVLIAGADAGFGIRYWHKKPEENTIVYVTNKSGLTFTCSVVSVPIHDHSSIVQGGPAYGTYFSDDSKE